MVKLIIFIKMKASLLNYIFFFVIFSLYSSGLWGQITPSNFNCQNSLNIDAVNPGTTNRNFISSVSGEEFWYTIKVESGLSTRYLSYSLINDLGEKPLYEYEIYGPFISSVNCNSLGTPTDIGASYLYSQPTVTSNCINYGSVYTSNPTIKKTLNSDPNNDLYFVLKVVPNATESCVSDAIIISSFSSPSTGSITQSSDYCEATNTASSTPCLTSTNCNTPFNVCSSFSYNHDLGSCNSINNEQLWFTLEINQPGATVNFNLNSNGQPYNISYFLTNNSNYGACDPNIYLSSSLLTQGNSGSFSYSFSNVGTYILLLDNLPDAPEISINIENNSCYECPTNESCSTAVDVWDSYELNNMCNGCSQYNNYFFILHVPSDNYTYSITSLPGVGSSSIQTFDYASAQIGNLSQCDPNLVNQIVHSGSGVTSALLTFSTAGDYMLKINYNHDCPHFIIDSPDNVCETCIGSFAPIPGEEYLVGAWVKEENASLTKTSYTYPEIYLHFTINNNGSISTNTVGPFTPSGAIIDGWQRIEEKVQIPIDAIDITIELSSSNGNVYYDDIRMFPFNASMKTFVYDPINMRLNAELDERHYATFYEYDEEGKLVRIKKETERGVMTIQETKSNSSK